MKQVTMESVKQRIADLESAGKVVGGLSLSSEFELACLRELVAVTDQRDAVVAESVALHSAAKKVIKMNRQHAKDQHGNPDIAESWACVKVLRNARASTATDAAIAALRAEGVEMFARALRVPGDDPFMDSIAVSVAGIADNFARQLRESKGAQS